MAYSPPTVTNAGLTIPTYADVLDDLVSNFRNIYGQSVYLGNDSADFQLLSVFALKISDVMRSLQLAYNNRSPVSAIGAALDSLVKLNGLARKSATYSTCQVTITGTAGTLIINGVVVDVNGNRWTLPSSVTIPAGGTLAATVTAVNLGAIQAQPGDISIIGTPTAGWISVTNSTAATPGLPIETDSRLRARQSVSVALPSITLLAGTVAAIAAVPNVTRYSVLENPTGSTDVNGLPPHSIAAVVEGGYDSDVAQAIYNNRGIGCYTDGDVVITITDPNNGGLTMPIRFRRPNYVPIFVYLEIHALPGYTSATASAIKANVVSYLNELQIGELVTISGIYGAALSAMPDLTQPLFSVRLVMAGTGVGSLSGTGTNDIELNFHEVAQGVADDVTLAEV